MVGVGGAGAGVGAGEGTGAADGWLDGAAVATLLPRTPGRLDAHAQSAAPMAIPTTNATRTAKTDARRRRRFAGAGTRCCSGGGAGAAEAVIGGTPAGAGSGGASATTGSSASRASILVGGGLASSWSIASVTGSKPSSMPRTGALSPPGSRRPARMRPSPSRRATTVCCGKRTVHAPAAAAVSRSARAVTAAAGKVSSRGETASSLPSGLKRIAPVQPRVEATASARLCPERWPCCVVGRLCPTSATDPDAPTACLRPGYSDLFLLS